MTRFTIILAVLVAFADIQSNVAKAYSEEEGDALKDSLSMTLVNSKNSAFNQVQHIKMSASTNTDIFIKRVNEMVEKAWSDMEILKNESGNVNPAICDKVKDDINNNALKTINTYQSCVLKVCDNMDWDMQSMSSDISILMKDIYAAETVDEELYRRTAEFEERSKQFSQYTKKLDKCDTQSNLPRLKRQISEALTSYTQCLKKNK